MYRPYVRAIKPRDAREVFGKTSQSNQFQVTFNGIPNGLSNHLREKFNVKNAAYFMGSKGNLLCSEASLPSSSLATKQIDNDFIGISQEFAHKRLYTDIDFTYLIDYDYKILRIFEGWVDYISSGSEGSDALSETTDNYYRRMRYPDDYKSQSMFVTKFEKDFQYRIDYQFYNIFPKIITAVPLSYGGAEVLKLTVSFNYDRYIVNPAQNISRGEGIRSDINPPQGNEVMAWKFGSQRSLTLFEELQTLPDEQIQDSFNANPQMLKGLTKTQIRNAFTNAATWTNSGAGGFLSGSNSVNNNNFRISEYNSNDSDASSRSASRFSSGSGSSSGLAS